MHPYYNFVISIQSCVTHYDNLAAIKILGVALSHSRVFFLSLFVSHTRTHTLTAVHGQHIQCMVESLIQFSSAAAAAAASAIHDYKQQLPAASAEFRFYSSFFPFLAFVLPSPSSSSSMTAVCLMSSILFRVLRPHSIYRPRDNGSGNGGHASHRMCVCVLGYVVTKHLAGSHAHSFRMLLLLSSYRYSIFVASIIS